MTFSTAELRVLNYFIRVADSALPREHPSRRHLPLLLQQIENGISLSRERNETDTRDGELETQDKIGTAEAAQLSGCTQRRIQQRIKNGELPAERFGRTYLIDRREIA